MVKEGELWRAAPVLGSFENAVPRSEARLLGAVADLEEWMMRERVLERIRMSKEGSEKVRKQILATIDEDDLKADAPGEVLDAFFEECRDGVRAGVLGYLGGLSRELPSDWQGRMVASEFAGEPDVREKWPWRLLCCEDVSRVLLRTEKDGDATLISYGFLDPALASDEEKSEIQVLHFRMRRDEEGRWSVDLPEALSENSAALLFEDDGLDENLVANFPERMVSKREQRPFVDFPAVRDELAKKLKAQSYEKVLERVNFGGRSQDARAHLREVGRLGGACRHRIVRHTLFISIAKSVVRRGLW